MLNFGIFGQPKIVTHEELRKENTEKQLFTNPDYFVNKLPHEQIGSFKALVEAQEKLDQRDKNKDGVLDKTEYQAAGEPDVLFPLTDFDGSNQLDIYELATVFKVHDRNKDNFLDDTERTSTLGQLGITVEEHDNAYNEIRSHFKVVDKKPEADPVGDLGRLLLRLALMMLQQEETESGNNSGYGQTQSQSYSAPPKKSLSSTIRNYIYKNMMGGS